MINPLKRVEVNHFTLRHPKVDDRTRNLVVAHVTDIHLGRWVKPRHVEDIAAYVNRQRVDLAVLTGDYVGYNKSDLAPCIEALDKLDVPAFATLGNHDHWASTELAEAAFARSAVSMLSNRSLSFTTHRGHALRIIGVDDAVTGHDDVAGSFAEATDDLLRLTLCHVPALAPQLSEAGADLMFSGHTHGLQFNVPGVARLLESRLGVKYIGGGYEVGGTLLYVSRGLGSASWPWRFRAAPELAFFTLQPGHRPELILDHRLQTTIAHAPNHRARRLLPAARATTPSPGEDL